MNQVLDLTKLRDAPVNTDFFPYCEVDCILKPDALSQVIHDFPKVQVRGSIPPHRLSYGPYFQKLLDELYHEDLRTLIAEKFQLNLSTAQTMITVRGQVNTRDGYIHTDTPSKLITVLLYLNEQWTESTGNLRLLKNGTNLEDYFAEITPTAGKLLVFKVTDNCWHGHYPFIGKRFTLQLNYVTNQSVVEKETKRHSRSFSLKKLTRLIKQD